MSKKATEPSKTDLMLVLRDLDRRPSSKTQALTDAEKVASDALKDFCRTNREYLKLSAAASKTSSLRYASERRDREVAGKKIQACRNAIRLRGVTPETVAAVEKLVKEMSC